MPDMLYFTHDCEKIIVAIEGELRAVDGGNNAVDPEGGVTIISGIHTSPSATRLNFTKFNDQ